MTEARRWAAWMSGTLMIGFSLGVFGIGCLVCDVVAEVTGALGFIGTATLLMSSGGQR